MNSIKSHRIHRHHLPTAILGFHCHPETPSIGYAACLDGVYQLDLESGESRQLYQHGSYASGVHVFPQHQCLVSCSYDGTVIWFDLAENRLRENRKVLEQWCWDLMAHSESGRFVVGGGQYLAGDYQYRPLPSDKPQVQVLDAASREMVAQFPFLPPVQAVGISDDGQKVAAANLMGDVAVWDVASGQELARWNTPDFTAFGIIKSHCQIGGIYSLMFTADDQVIVCGMGPMRDPMAGNGKQRWQRFAWKDQSEVQKVAATKDEQAGEGLMETLCWSNDRQRFVMAGRLRGGAWSTGLFDLATGELIHSIKSDSRVTKAQFQPVPLPPGKQRLLLAGAINQSEDPNHKFGVLDVFELTEVPAEEAS